MKDFYPTIFTLIAFAYLFYDIVITQTGWGLVVIWIAFCYWSATDLREWVKSENKKQD